MHFNYFDILKFYEGVQIGAKLWRGEVAPRFDQMPGGSDLAIEKPTHLKCVFV